jgi:hypothetical protein
MNTVTIEIDRHSAEWSKLKAFVHSLGLSMTESVSSVRTGWAEAAQKMHECGDDRLLIDDVFDDETLEP